MATDTPAKPIPAAQPAAEKPEGAATAKPKSAAARKRGVASKRAATKPRAASAKRAAAREAAAAPKTPPVQPTDRNRAAVVGVLDAQERTANAFADYHTRAAELSRIPGATTLATAHADLMRRVAATYVTAARDLLK